MDKQNEKGMVDLLNQEMRELQESQKQIEELTNELSNIQTYAYMDIYPCRQLQPNEIVAEHLVRKGWIKPAESAVVLTREAYNRLFTKARQSEIKTIDLESIVNARKETAEKFREMLTKDRQALDVKDCEKREVCDKAYIIPQSFIDEIAKEITEGEKEISNETV